MPIFVWSKVKKMKAYAGDVSKLPLADSFLFMLIQLPRLAANLSPFARRAAAGWLVVIISLS